MILAALVHSTGVFFCGRFILLEMAFSDCTGLRHTFLVNSPVTFRTMKTLDPRLPVESIVTRTGGTPLWYVVAFLRERYAFLSDTLPAESVCFGIKGSTFQPEVLDRAGVPHVDVGALLNLPGLHMLRNGYLHRCPFHASSAHGCAQLSLVLLEEAIAERTSFWRSSS